jgi:hypothetical protein
VQPLGDSDTMAFRHAFQIFFPHPVAPGEKFDVVYAIRLPGELKVLSATDEIMSVSLARIPGGVGKLEFNVCLSFNPSSVSVECQNRAGESFACKPPGPTISPYERHTWYESELDINWSEQPYKIGWAIEQPDMVLYIIHYRK